MEGGKANRYTALQGGDGESKFCQKVRYVTVERSLFAKSSILDIWWSPEYVSVSVEK